MDKDTVDDLKQFIATIIHSEVNSAVDTGVRSVVKEEVEAAVNKQVRSVVREEVETAVDKQVRSVVKEEVETAVDKQVRSVIKEEVRAVVKDELQPVHNKIDELSDFVRNAIDDSNEANGQQLADHERRITKLEHQAA